MFKTYLDMRFKLRQGYAALRKANNDYYKLLVRWAYTEIHYQEEIGRLIKMNAVLVARNYALEANNDGDVCAWEWQPDIELWQTSCGDTYDLDAAYDFEYCPYCSRKIIEDESD